MLNNVYESGLSNSAAYHSLADSDRQKLAVDVSEMSPSNRFSKRAPFCILNNCCQINIHVLIILKKHSAVNNFQKKLLARFIWIMF